MAGLADLVGDSHRHACNFQGAPECARGRPGACASPSGPALLTAEVRCHDCLARSTVVLADARRRQIRRLTNVIRKEINEAAKHEEEAIPSENLVPASAPFNPFALPRVNKWHGLSRRTSCAYTHKEGKKGNEGNDDELNENHNEGKN